MSKKISYRCQVLGCASTNLSPKHLYRFPKDKERCKIWVDFSNNPKLLDKTASHIHELKICEDHFAEWCFMSLQDKSRLVHNAVPGALIKSDSPLQSSTQMYLDTISSDSLNSIDLTPVMIESTPVTITKTNASPVTPSLSKITNRRKKYTPTKMAPCIQHFGSDEEDDLPLSKMIGHPDDDQLRALVSKIVKESNLEDVTMKHVIRKVFETYPKYDLNYRKEFIRSNVRSILSQMDDQS